MKNNEENTFKNGAEKIAPLTSASLKASLFYADLDKILAERRKLAIIEILKKQKT